MACGFCRGWIYRYPQSWQLRTHIHPATTLTGYGLLSMGNPKGYWEKVGGIQSIPCLQLQKENPEVNSVAGSDEYH